MLTVSASEFLLVELASCHSFHIAAKRIDDVRHILSETTDGEIVENGERQDTGGH
jgi:hypothetical protein